MYRTRTPEPGRGFWPNESMAQRKAANVLPEPVGAHNNVFSPALIGAQACACAAVGVENEDSNQARTAGEKGERGSAATH